MDFFALESELQAQSAMTTGEDAQQRMCDKYQLLEELGHGAYGTVTKARSKQTGSFFALKHIDKIKAGTKGLSSVYSEVETMSLLRHQYIVHLEEVFQDDNNLWIVMEYVPGGELARKLKAQGKFGETIVRRIAANLLLAVDYIHSKGIVHRDLKPANCLLSEEGEGELKIADFGFAVMVGRDATLNSFCGTTSYMAPEILMDMNYGKPVDMWAIGVILHVLVSGDMPFTGSSTEELTSGICAGVLAFKNPVWDTMSVGCKDLISRLLVVDPIKRLTARDALKHYWIKSAMEDFAGDEMAQSLSRRIVNWKRKFRVGAHVVTAAHRLVHLARLNLLKRQGMDVAPLRNFAYSIRKKFESSTKSISASGLCPGNIKALTALTNMLESSELVETFDVSSNAIDNSDVVQQIVRVASGHPNLTALHLENNPIPSGVAARALVRLSRSSGKIRTLNVNNTAIGAETIQQIVTAMRDADKKKHDVLRAPAGSNRTHSPIHHTPNTRELSVPSLSGSGRAAAPPARSAGARGGTTSASTSIHLPAINPRSSKPH